MAFTVNTVGNVKVLVCNMTRWSGEQNKRKHLFRAWHTEGIGPFAAAEEALVGAGGARPGTCQQGGQVAAGRGALSWHAAARQLAHLPHCVPLAHRPLVLPAACMHASCQERKSLLGSSIKHKQHLSCKPPAHFKFWVHILVVSGQKV